MSVRKLGGERFKHSVSTTNGGSWLALGVQLYRLFGEQAPTVVQIQRHYSGISRATAYRWVRGYKDALGLP